MKFALLNLDITVPADDCAKMADALTIYDRDYLSPAYGLQAASVEYLKGMSVAPSGYDMSIYIFDRPEGAGYLGYHTKADGRVFSSLIPGKVTLRDPNGKGASILAVLMHEYAEIRGDFLAGDWADGPFIDPNTRSQWDLVARELCDPVQESAFTITLPGGQQVDASNFILPSWFNCDARDVKFDQMGVLRMPLTIAPGGYVIVRRIKNEGSIFGRVMGRAKKEPAVKKIYHEVCPEEWREQMKEYGGRTAKRLKRHRR